MTSIWFKDPSIFIDKEQLLQFIPDQSMSFEEQMNAVMRFAIYFAIIVFVIRRDYRVFYFPIFVGFITWLIYSTDLRQSVEKRGILEKLSLRPERDGSGFCTKPTKQNPFMNVLMNEYKEFPSRPKACNVQSGKVKSEMKQWFDSGSYRDVDDIFERKSNDRQFYTVPSTTIPNAQVDFAKWLYGTPSTCKESSMKCLIR